ncbi:MAG: molybdopterin-guanine dinucleotide biosynthesis protein B [Thermoplasmatota archaeon]
MIIVALIGLKKSGKTTTAEALIREFGSRGYKVGAVKFMTLSKFTVDTEGKDTWRHMNAGADFVVSLSDGEMAYIERRAEHAGLSDAMRHMPDDAEILICEGLNEEHPGVIRILLAREPGMVDVTLKTRGMEGPVAAYSGIMASKVKQLGGVPVFDCTDPVEASGLADLILRLSENEA